MFQRSRNTKPFLAFSSSVRRLCAQMCGTNLPSQPSPSNLATIENAACVFHSLGRLYLSTSRQHRPCHNTEALANCDDLVLPALSSLFIGLLPDYRTSWPLLLLQWTGDQSYCADLFAGSSITTKLQFLETSANTWLLSSYYPITSKNTIVLTTSESITLMGRWPRTRKETQ